MPISPDQERDSLSNRTEAHFHANQRPFTFLHTADWQIGMKAAGLGHAAEAVRRARLAAAERVIELANHRGVECVVIAGDVFEDNGVDPYLVQQVVDILERAACPVFILPGNHDPLVAGSVYNRDIWQRTTKVTVWRKSEPYPLRPGVVLYPCPYLTRRTAEDPTDWIPRREPGENVIRIGVAHGSLRGIATSDDLSASMIDPDAAARHDLDYLALGHWHSTFFYPVSSPGNDVTGVVRTAYSGTHETSRFGERDSGNVLIVDIPAPGEPPRLEQVKSGELSWRQIDRELNSVDDFDILLHALDGEDPSSAAKTLLELTLRGVVSAEVMLRIEHDLEPLLRSRYLYTRLNEDGLLFEPTEAELLAIAAAGPVRATCEHLLQLSREAETERDRAVARLALAELYMLSKERLA